MEQEPPEPRYMLMIEFDSDDPEFVRGAEYGAIEERLRILRDEEVEQIMHRANEEMVRRLSVAYGREYCTRTRR